MFPHRGESKSPSSPAKSPTSSKSFASVLKNSTTSPKFPSDDQIPLIPPSTHHGEPALKMPQQTVDRLSSSFRLTLVGEFSHGRPSIDRSRQIFAKLYLKGNFFLSLLDSKHILIQLEYEGDFHRLWLKE